MVMERARPLRLVALGKSSPVGTITGCKGHGAPCLSLAQGELEKKRGTEVRTASRGRGHVAFAGAHRGVPARQRGQCLSTKTPRGSTGWAMGFVSADTCWGEGGGAKLGSFVPSDACGGEVCRKPGEGSAWGSSRLPAPALAFMGPILGNPTEANPRGQSSALEPSPSGRKRGEAEIHAGLASPGAPGPQHLPWCEVRCPVPSRSPSEPESPRTPLLCPVSC